jgi:hypothetical protein
MISETRILLRARTTGVFSPSACWNFCRKNPGRAERRGRRRFTKGRRGLTLPGLTARLSSVVRPHDGAARSRAAGLQGRGIWGGKPGIGVHRSHCAIRRSSAPQSPPSAGHLLRLAFGSPSCCAMLLTPDAGGRTALPVRCIGRQVPKPAAGAKLPDLALPYLN